MVRKWGEASDEMWCGTRTEEEEGDLFEEMNRGLGD